MLNLFYQTSDLSPSRGRLLHDTYLSKTFSWISLQCKLYNLTTVWLQVHRMDRKLDQTLVLLNTLTKSLVVAKPRTKSVTGKQDGNTSDKYCDSDDMMDVSEKASLSPNV